jgi:drug/metabolite transporter (DMT)-like permease
MDSARTTLDADDRKRLKATAIGFVAVLLWALLALFTAWAGPLPPFQLVAMSFTVAFAVSVGFWVARGGRRALAKLRQPWPVWLLGVAGLFGYHLFYFTALGNAPAVEASLIAYLWPLLIVVFSALLPGERLAWHHLVGAAMGLAGAGLLVTGGGSVTLKAEFALGYAAAVACALTWSSYSVASRRFGAVPTDVVGGFCGASAVLGFLCHLALESTVWPEGWAWLAVLGLGLGPVGAAFFVWDYGVKHGDIQTLGVAAYGAPLLSTLLLIAFGLAPLTWVVALACALIVGGALLAARNLLGRRRAPAQRQV